MKEGRAAAIVKAKVETSFGTRLQGAEAGNGCNVAAVRQLSDDAPPTKLALFLPNLNGGGAEGIMLLLARGFVERGFSVDMVLVRDQGPLRESLHDEVKVVNLGASRVSYSVPSLVAYLKRERPYAMLATMTHANLVAILARLLTGTSTRLVIRQATTASREFESVSILNRCIHHGLMRLFYPLADGIVGVSRGVCEDLTDLLKMRSEAVTLAYNPVVTPELQQSAREEIDHAWFQEGEPPVVIGMGRLSKEKDFATLIRAFSRVRAQLPARLVILGEGGERAALETLSAELGVAEDVALPGFMTSPFPYVARSQVFVLSSIFEGLPSALIQAMSLGVPVVSTDCPSGPEEILDRGRYGRLVSVGDDVGMAKEIHRILSCSSDTCVKNVPAEHVAKFEYETSIDEYLMHLVNS